MKDKILKLAKRLDRFRLEDIEPILNCEGVNKVLQELVAEKRLVFDGSIYSYKEPVKHSPLPFCFKFHMRPRLANSSCETQKNRCNSCFHFNYTAVYA